MSHDSSVMTQKSRSPIRAILRSIARRLRNERQYQHLDGLPDHLLRDVGLDRTDIATARRDNRLFWPTHFN